MNIKNLSTEQVETLIKIYYIIDTYGLFTLNDLRRELPYLTYHGVLMRLKRLINKGLIEKRARGVYKLTDEGKKVVQMVLNR